MTDMGDLTPRQIAVASMVAKGMTTKTIAHELRITDRRVRVLITSIAFRIGADPQRDERVQVALWWQDQTGKLPDAA